MQFNLFVCGSGSSFLHQVDDNDPFPVSCPKSHKKRRNKNPYSSCGQEKFLKVLADLEEERRKIYRRMGSEEKLLVRFVHKDGKEWVPIVVKLNSHKEKSKKKVINPAVDREKCDAKPMHVDVENKVIEEAKPIENDETKRKRDRKLLRRVGADYYWYMVVVLILLCLAMFNRSFAIVCASVWWFLLSSVNGEDIKMTRSMKKKSVERKLRSMKRVSPRRLRKLRSSFVLCAKNGLSGAVSAIGTSQEDRYVLDRSASRADPWWNRHKKNKQLPDMTKENM